MTGEDSGERALPSGPGTITSEGASAEQTGPGPEIQSAPDRLGYHPALDGVRAIAILAVLALHSGYRVFGSGAYGVDVFFVLSGFLITTLLLQEQAGTGRISCRLFYGRRAARLLPALVAACGIVAIVAAVNAVESVRPVLNPTPTATAFVGIAIALGYVAAWVHALSDVSLGALSHTWSLSVEEWFYAVWPPLLIAFLRWPRWTNRLVVAAAATAIAYRLLSEEFVASKEYLYFAPDERACELLIGCVLGSVMFAHKPRLLRHPRALTWAGLLGAGGVVLMMAWPTSAESGAGVHIERGAVVLLGIATVSALACVVALPQSLLARGLSIGPLVWVGRRSYGLYLYHFVLILLISPWQANGHVPWRNGGIAFVLAFVVSDVSYRWLEQPIIRRMRGRERRLRGHVSTRTRAAATAEAS